MKFAASFVLLILAISPAFADSAPPPSIELDVNAWATFTAATNPQLTETIAVSFLYTPTTTYINQCCGLGPPLLTGSGTIIPGTLSMGSSGFLGTFSASDSYGGTGGTINGFTAFINSLGGPGHNDQITLDWGCCQNADIQPGVNTAGFYIADCVSQSCINSEGEGWANGDEALEGPNSMVATKGGSLVTAAPDGDSEYLMGAVSVGVVGLAWRYKRRGEVGQV